MSTKFKEEDRVRIADTHHWAKGALGTIRHPPLAIKELESAWVELYRKLQKPSGARYSYWVVFDEGHDDGSGDGPYREAEIEEDYLEHVTTSIAEQFAPPEPPLPGSRSDAPVRRALDSLPAPASDGGR